MRLFTIPIIVLVGIILTGAAPQAQADDDPCNLPPGGQLRKASKAMLSGPTKKKLCLNGHKFRDIRRATVVRKAKTPVLMTGEFRHHKSFWFDDRVYYEVPFVNGAVDFANVKIEFEDNGLAKLIGQLAVTFIPSKIVIAGSAIDI